MRDRLAEILDQLRPEDGDWLIGQLPSARVRQRARDDAIRRLAEAHYADLPPGRPRASAIASDLAREQSLGAPMSARRRDLARILRLNDGRCLGERQVWNILVGVHSSSTDGNLPP